MSNSNTATLDVFGDTLEVRWDGNVWVAPCCGSQHSRAKAAMEVELTHYLRACGEDTDGMEDEIETMLGSIEYAAEPDAPAYTAEVMDYASGDKLGEVEFPADQWAAYEAEAHKSFEWPAGIAAAGDVIDAAALEDLGIEAGRTIWLK